MIWREVSARRGGFHTCLCQRALLLGLLIVPASWCVAADWPTFRGPDGNGVASSVGDVPTAWDDSSNVRWRLKLPGAGFSSPIVVGDRVFVTAWTGSGDSVKRFLVCVDRDSGKENWSVAVDGVSDGGEQGFAYHGQASHTPVSDGDRVYVLFGSSGVKAYDLEGKLVWEQSVGQERAARFGTASSPILYGDLLIVTAGCESESIRAFKKQTGEEVWKAEAGSLSRTYSTPLIAKAADGEDELLLSVAMETWGLRPTTGKIKWYAETKVDTAACPTVVVDDGIVYVIGGRGGGRAAIRQGGEGDVTDSHVLWSESGGSYVPSPVFHQGRLYWVNDRGIATCVDAKTGEELGRKRLDGRFYASVVLVNDLLYAVSRFDGTYVLKATPEFEQVSQNKLDDDSDFSASPAVSDGTLFLRSDEYLYCISSK